MMHLPSVQVFLIAFFSIINIIGFLIMGIDKLKARKRGFRVPEATLFLIALIGGAAGSLLGMYVFRHKTLHRKFTIGIPVILLLQIIIILFLMFGPFFNIRTI